MNKPEAKMLLEFYVKKIPSLHFRLVLTWLIFLSNVQNQKAWKARLI